MYRSTLSSTTMVAALVAATPVVASAQQSDLAISPFVSFLPSMGSNPLAGLALTLAGDGGFGLRASGHLSLENSNNSLALSNSAMRPWGADADAILSIGGRAFGGSNRTFAPFAFAGIGTASDDSGSYRVRHTNWSYGVGASLPLGRVIDLFGESRWRMSRYVLPTADFAPTPTQELRFGVSVHVGALGRGTRARSVPVRTSSTVSIPTGRYPGTASPSTSAARVLNTADDYLGVHYVYGGTSPSGFDCSGFTQYVFGKHGVNLPRTARQQAQVGTPLPPDWRAVSAGDLVMFADGGAINHVAIYAGRNRIIHSSSSGGGVRYDDLSTSRGSWFVDHMVAARRVTPDAHGLLLDLAREFATPGLHLDGPDHAPKP